MSITPPLTNSSEIALKEEQHILQNRRDEVLGVLEKLKEERREEKSKRENQMTIKVIITNK